MEGIVKIIVQQYVKIFTHCDFYHIKNFFKGVIHNEKNRYTEHS